MPDAAHVALFAAAALLLVFVPGPNTLYVVARSVQQGRAAGVVSSLGIQVATIVQIAAAAAGISSLLLSSAAAFDAVRYAGALYLIVLGVRTLLRRDVDGAPRDAPRASLGAAFAQGVVVNLLNPKSALFLFAFLPQFVDPARGSAAGQTVALGSILLVFGFASDVCYAFAAGSARRALARSMRLRRFQRYFSGGVYVSLGLATAVSGGRG